MNRIRDRRWDGKSRWEPCHVLSPLPVSADDEISAEPRKVAGNEITPDRRHSLRQKVNTPAVASFDGVTGGVILDLSEEGLAMHTAVPLEPHRRLSLHLGLSEATQLDTTGYIAWADALGRAGVRFSDLPEEARHRIDHWLALNDQAPSRKAPKLTVDRVLGPNRDSGSPANGDKTRSISLEAESAHGNVDSQAPISTSVQYEFHSLGPDLNAALRIISERARTLLRGSGAAIALIDHGPMMCRASVGTGGPPLGTRVEIDSGFTGECIRSRKALRCDDAETDSRVVAEICQRLSIRSIAAAPMLYERDVVGLVEVFSAQSFAFDEGDLAILERLAQTVLLTVSQTQPLKPRKPRRSPATAS